MFVDIEPDTYNIDPAQIEAAITERTRAIIPVHLYGQTADMDRIAAVVRPHGLAILEDAAQAIGAAHQGSRAGTLGDVAAFSFYPSKNLGGFGDGGMITTGSTRSSPAEWPGSACTAWSRSIITMRSDSTPGSTRCRRPCSG